MGAQPSAVLGCTSTAAFTLFPGAQDAPSCPGATRPLASIPNLASCRPPRLCAVSSSPQSQGQSRWAAGRRQVPPCHQAVCQPIPPASAPAESPARYSPHKGPIFLWFCRAGVTGSKPAAPGAPTLKPGPRTKKSPFPQPFSLFCMNGKHSFYKARKREGAEQNQQQTHPQRLLWNAKRGAGGCKAPAPGSINPKFSD